jgi:hypothetical protein
VTDKLQELKTEFRETATHCQRFCFAARAREYQVEAIEQLENLNIKVTDLKAEMIATQEEDYANQLLSIEEMIDALTHELKMWVAFKDDDPHTAWTNIVEAQGSVRSAMQAHEIAGHLQPYVEHLYALEKLLFPPQTFMSVGMIVKRSTCSICGMEYGDCEHVVGKAYLGQICARVIEEVDLREASVVLEPANKHCRILTISDENGTRDLMTWRLVPERLSDQNPGDIVRQHLLKGDAEKNAG